MAKHSLSLGVAALAATAVLLPAQALAEHENRYFGFGWRPYVHNPPVYALPPGVRETAPGIYEYQVAPGRWVRFRPAYAYQPSPGRDRPARARQQPQEAVRAPEPTPVPQSRPPEEPAEPEVAVQSAPSTTAPSRSAAQVPATASGPAISCEAAADIVEDFGFSDVQSTSCSGATYGFDATRDGSAYAIKLSSTDGALTEVRKR